jgi:hypothetical protein
MRASKEKDHNDNAKDHIGRSRPHIYSGNRRADAGRAGARFNAVSEHDFQHGPNGEETRKAH